MCSISFTFGGEVPGTGMAIETALFYHMIEKQNGQSTMDLTPHDLKSGDLFGVKSYCTDNFRTYQLKVRLQMWPSTWILAMTWTFQGQIFVHLYLREKLSQYLEMKNKPVNWMLGLKYDHPFFTLAMTLTLNFLGWNIIFAISKEKNCVITMKQKRTYQLDGTLLWHHNERDGVSNHRGLCCLLNGLFRGRSKKTSKLRVTGLWEGNSPVTGEFPAQRASNAENVSIWWRHHG